MKSQRIFAFVVIGTGVFGATWGQAEEITGGDVRVVLDGKYALTSEGYAEYRKCIANIPFGGPITDYNAALEQCKSRAINSAFVIPPSSPASSSTSSIPEDEGLIMEEGLRGAASEETRGQAAKIKDRAWQQQIYKRIE